MSIIDGTSATDRLEVIGVIAGGFLVLVGLGTLVGMPWQHNDSAVVAAGQIFGSLATVAVGVWLAWLAYDRE